MADGFDKYIKFEKLRRSQNSTMQDYIPEWNTASTTILNIGCSLSDKVLTFKLLDAAYLSLMERNLVLTSINYGEAKLKEQMESTLRKFVGRTVLSVEVSRTEDSTYVTRDNIVQVLLAGGWVKTNKQEGRFSCSIWS